MLCGSKGRVEEEEEEERGMGPHREEEREKSVEYQHDTGGSPTEEEVWRKNLMDEKEVAGRDPEHADEEGQEGEREAKNGSIRSIGSAFAPFAGKRRREENEGPSGDNTLTRSPQFRTEVKLEGVEIQQPRMMMRERDGEVDDNGAGKIISRRAGSDRTTGRRGRNVKVVVAEGASGADAGARAEGKISDEHKTHLRLLKNRLSGVELLSNTAERSRRKRELASISTEIELQKLRRENVVLKEKLALVQSLSSRQVELLLSIKEDFLRPARDGEQRADGRSERLSADGTGCVKEEEQEQEQEQEEEQEEEEEQERDLVQERYCSLLQRLHGLMEEEDRRFMQLSNRLDVLVLQDTARLSESEVRMREMEQEKILAMSALSNARVRFAEAEQELLDRIGMLEAQVLKGRGAEVPAMLSTCRAELPHLSFPAPSFFIQQPAVEQPQLMISQLFTSHDTLELASKFASQASEILDSQSFLKFVNMLKMFKEGGLTQEQLVSKVKALFPGRHEMLLDFLKFLS
eukprot:757639-Hanusia_phi.AAC.4